MPHKAENFHIPDSFIRAINVDEMHATFDAMVECEIDRAPFEELYITIPENTVIKVTKDGKDADPQPEMGVMEFHFIGLDKPLSQIPELPMKVLGWRGKRYVDYLKYVPTILDDKPELVQQFKTNITEAGQTYLKLLVVALATKGVKKGREQNKLARLGIGKGQKSRHSYTTTISAPGPTGLEADVTGTGITLRPHLRRGHVRRQHYGPGHEFVKKIFIEAVFVNSDREFVSMRERYNVSLKQGDTST